MDGAGLLAAERAAHMAHRAKANASRFRKRSATRTVNDTDARHHAAEQIVRARWQSIPHSESGLPAWAKAVAQRQADHEPEIIEARAEATKAHRIAKEIAARQSREHMVLFERVLGNRRPSAVAARVEFLREQAVQDRRYLTQLDELAPDEAVQLVYRHVVEAQQLATEESHQTAATRDARSERDFERRHCIPSHKVDRHL